MAIQNTHHYSYPETNSDDTSGPANPAGGWRARSAYLAMHDRDWDALFDAVAQRLTESVSELPTSRPADLGAASYGFPATFALDRVKGQVLDCVEALAKLHAALRVKRAIASEQFRSDC